MNDVPSQGGQSGFTIVETMIVLAVTGFMLLAALFLVVGQQSKVEFSQSVREVESAIQQGINEVGSGYYPNPGNLDCSPGAGKLNISDGSNAQGTNADCIFLGKAIQFGEPGVDDRQQYVVHSIAGQLNNEGMLTKAYPTSIAPGNTTNNTGGPNFPDASTTKQLLYGLKVVSMKYFDGGSGSGVPIGAVAFISELGTFLNPGYETGTQQITLIPVGGTEDGVGNFVTAKETVVDRINTNLSNPALSPPDPSGGVAICFASGSTDQSGLITIGNNSSGGTGRSLAVSLAIKGSVDCT